MNSEPSFADLAQVDRFVERFASGELPKAEWTHRGHLAAGLWHVLKHGGEKTVELLRERIRRHNEAVGTANTDSNGYHESITKLYVLGIAEFLASRPISARNSIETYRDLFASEMGESSWPSRYYTRERLFSVEARRTWVEPDVRGAPGAV